MLKFLIKKNAQDKIRALGPLLKNSEKILDVGCGDLVLAENLLKFNPKLKITGVDVVDFNRRPKGIKFIKYDGKILPFKNSSFDSVILYHVLHHCKHPISVLKECLRLTRKRIIVAEPIYLTRLEIPIMRFWDWFFNALKKEPIALPYQFFSKNELRKIFNKLHLQIVKEKNIFIPIGRGCLFSLIKKSETKI